jgi:hypothetical protein
MIRSAAPTRRPETCSFGRAAPGTYFAAVQGLHDFSDAQLAVDAYRRLPARVLAQELVLISRRCYWGRSASA